MDGSSFLAAFAAESQSGDAAESGANAAAAAAGDKGDQQVVSFNGAGIDSFPIKAKHVTILPSQGDHDVGSSKLKISTIVDYGWEHKYYAGQLVATHHLGNFFAYGIYTPTKQAGVVRVVFRSKDGGSQDSRGLIKGMKGKVEDLSFAHCPDKIYLAIVDSSGTLFVYNIHYSNGEVQTNMMLEVHSPNAKPGSIHRVIWCPFLPDCEEDEDTNSRLLVHINDCVADMWNMDAILEKHGGGTHSAEDITACQLRISGHTEAISDASFSPDGTALATASLDGQVKFFQVYMLGSQESPRCLHQWAPHDGRPVSCLFFLDNHRNYNPDVQFWKYAVTGAENNCEIKIWACESWECIQTIKFHLPLMANPMLKASLDLSARYLMLSNIYHKFVYILNLTPNKDDESKVSVVSVSEFATPSPFLSLAIKETGLCKELENTDNDDSDRDDDDDDSEDEDERAALRDATSIKFLLVNPKSLQECRILYNDASNHATAVVNGVEQEYIEPSVNEGVSVISAFVAASRATVIKQESVDSEVKDPALNEAAKKITLMSPEVFVTNEKAKVQIKEEPASPAETKPTNLNINAIIIPSGGSSPSRGVQNILADSEENGGMLNDVVITEEDSDEESVAEDAEDYDEDAEFEALDKNLAATKALANVKTEIKQEEFEDEEDDVDPLSNFGKILNISSSSNPSHKSSREVASQQNQAWQNLVAKRGANSPKLNRSFEIRSDNPPPVLQTPAQQPPPFLPTSASSAESFDAASAYKNAIGSLNAQMRHLCKSMDTMSAFVQLQYDQVQDLRSEVKGYGVKSSKDRLEAEQMMRKVDGLTNGAAISQKIDASIKREFKKLSGDITKQTSQVLHQQLAQEVQSRLSKSDQALRDAITKMATSKTSTDALAAALTSSLSPVLQASFRDVFGTVLTPAFERAMQNLFVNISQTFTKGTKEYETLIKSHVNALTKDVKDAARQLEKAKTIQNTEIDKVMDNFQHVLLSEIRETARQQRSLSGTPVTSLSSQTAAEHEPIVTQEDIVNLLRHGAFNEAFQQALSAKNLELVVMTCEMVNPSQIFGQTKVPLTQSVLLSLIQQLGAKLHDRTELKLKYLEEAVMNLDTTDASNQANITLVASQLIRQLEEFLNKNPQLKKTKLKMLYMATKALL